MLPFYPIGLTDKTIPRRLGPKRVGKIRKLYNLSKEDDVRQYVIRRPLPLKEGKKQQYKVCDFSFSWKYIDHILY